MRRYTLKLSPGRKGKPVEISDSFSGLLDAAAHQQRDADAVDREAVDEVGGAVQGVDQPDVIGARPAVLAARFLGPDAVVRIGPQQGFDDRGLGRVVDLGDEIVGLLLRDADGLDVERGPVDDRAGGASGLDGHVEHGVLVGRHVVQELGAQGTRDARRRCGMPILRH
jgi:hypothetical protein